MKNIMLPVAVAVLVGGSLTPALGQRQQRQPQQQQNQETRIQQMASTVVQNAVEALAAQSDPLQLIYRKDVQRDLQLELAARNRFANLRDKQLAELTQARRLNRRNGGSLIEAQEKHRKETQDKIDELLTDKQKKRLEQIARQLQGEASVSSAAVQKAIAATPEQIQQFQEVIAGRDRKITALQSEVGSRSLAVGDVPTRVQQIHTETNEALAALLTEDQREMLKSLFGAPFKADS